MLLLWPTVVTNDGTIGVIFGLIRFFDCKCDATTQSGLSRSNFFLIWLQTAIEKALHVVFISGSGVSGGCEHPRRDVFVELEDVLPGLKDLFFWISSLVVLVSNRNNLAITNINLKQFHEPNKGLVLLIEISNLLCWSVVRYNFKTSDNSESLYYEEPCRFCQIFF